MSSISPDHARPAERRLLETSDGTLLSAFGAPEWGLLVGIALVWGSSFLLISVGLESLAPGMVALLRVGLGAATLALFPRARRAVPREDLPRIAFLGIIWIGIPFLLFPIAQQHVDSSVAGMLNGAMPVATAAWATLLLRRLPGRVQMLGIAVGFAGIVLVFLPELQESQATAFGALLLVVAVLLYGLATNLVVPLQQRHGSLAVILRAQLSALVLIAPVGLSQLGRSSFELVPVLAMLPLGILGTGLALVGMATLAGRVGSTRGSIAIYVVPVVAIVLGVTVLSEQLAPIALLGMGLVLLGAWLTSRSET